MLGFVLLAVYVALIVQGLFPSLAGADADHVVYGIDKDDAVARLTRPRRFADGGDGLFDVVVAEDDMGDLVKARSPFFIIRAHLAVFDEWLIDQLGRQDNLAALLQGAGPKESLVQRLADGKAAVTA